MTVEDVITRWPQTAAVFTRRNMACVGCPVSHLYSIAEAAAVYGLEVDDFVRELQRVVASESIQDQ
jgi:hybrid cluster-associated redox disulfide protein